MALGTLKRLRLEAGLTQRKVARLLGVAYETICRIENGKRNPSDEMLERLAQLYGADPAELRGGMM